MEESYVETLRAARERANRQIVNPRERAIVIRYIEDALARAHAVESNLFDELPPR